MLQTQNQPEPFLNKQSEIRTLRHRGLELGVYHRVL